MSRQFNRSDENGTLTSSPERWTLNDQFGMPCVRSACIIIWIIILNIFEKAHDYFYQDCAIDITLFYACPYVDVFHNGDVDVWVRRAFRRLICCLMTMGTRVFWSWRVPYWRRTCISTSGYSWVHLFANGVMWGIMITWCLSSPVNLLILVFFSESTWPFPMFMLCSVIGHPPEKNRPK